MENKTKPMMSCGHIANSYLKKDGEYKIPYCVMCDCTEIVEKPNLENRKAKCSDCKSIVDSNNSLAFFGHNPDEEYDEYYCGCRGWD